MHLTQVDHHQTLEFFYPSTDVLLSERRPTQLSVVRVQSSHLPVNHISRWSICQGLDTCRSMVTTCVQQCLAIFEVAADWCELTVTQHQSINTALSFYHELPRLVIFGLRKCHCSLLPMQNHSFHTQYVVACLSDNAQMLRLTTWMSPLWRSTTQTHVH